MRWTELPIHFIDFEGSTSSGVLEYGVVRVLRGSIVSTTTRFCRAVGRIRDEDTAVHGLERGLLADYAPFTDDFEYFASCREAGPLAAHFAGVENSLLKSAWPYPRTSPDFARPGAQLTDWGPWVDSARLYEQLYPSLTSARLETLVSAFGLQPQLEELAAAHCPGPRRRYHAALFDALAGALLLARLAQEPQVSQWDVRQLLAFSTLNAQKREDLTQGSLFDA